MPHKEAEEMFGEPISAKDSRGYHLILEPRRPVNGGTLSDIRYEDEVTELHLGVE